MPELLFEKGVKGSNAFTLPPSELPADTGEFSLPAEHLRDLPPAIPELSEVEVVRHYMGLSHLAYGVDDGMYPLGSCTMKYNPKINEWAARLPGFADIHPLQPENSVQGAMAMLYELEGMLNEIGGMDRFTLQPAAGAHGEFVGIRIIRAYHMHRDDDKRTVILVPDSAHGTNPATASAAGFKMVEVKSDPLGMVDMDDLKHKLNDEVAGLMLTNPNTLGLFEKNIVEIARLVHEAGGLLYYDGANLNAVMGVSRPGDMGFDIVHYNLHKTFATPHGGGGPGSGPVGVKAFLADFLPRPTVELGEDGKYFFDYDHPLSIGKVKSFYGNFGVMVKAYAYIKALGAEGIKDACVQAVLNANYLRHHLADTYDIPYNVLCKHEFVATARRQLEESHISTMDIAKRLIDYGYHPPTVYFPLIVKEAMMLEPTETESRERLDEFIAVMKNIAREAKETPDIVHAAPTRTIIGRVDEVTAARHPVLSYQEEKQA
ncbi:MAG: aminomethyl-transferring glycine dehydrogenase subunit GcvPB [Syntrophomonadaceae bacterium]|nr:aminomethyl-transferring glycine dehydrogenase subunit GcvPB [Syntrophomonadaceae bacterium]